MSRLSVTIHVNTGLRQEEEALVNKHLWTFMPDVSLTVNVFLSAIPQIINDY